jgi:hypothetical protein
VQYLIMWCVCVSVSLFYFNTVRISLQFGTMQNFAIIVVFVICYYLSRPDLIIYDTNPLEE